MNRAPIGHRAGVMAWTGDRRTESINRQPVNHEPKTDTSTTTSHVVLVGRCDSCDSYRRIYCPHGGAKLNETVRKTDQRVNRSVLWACGSTQPVRGGVHAHILFGETSTAQALSRKQKGRSHRATARAAQRVAFEAYACRMVAVPRCVSQATEPPWSGPGLASRHCTNPSRFSHA